MAKLEVTPAAPFTEYIELNFRGLYLYHTGSGPKANQAGVIENKAPIGIGATVVNNWQVYDGPDEDPNKLVARAQGLHLYAGKWHNSFSLVFENERFKGSTLEVMGIVVETGEWAVVGGTGQFAMANGVISKKVHGSISGGDIIELTIRAFCPKLKGTTFYIQLGGSEVITEVSGTLGTFYDATVVTSIKFVTSLNKTYGPWGGGQGTPFTIPVQPGTAIVGFFARGATYLHAIGAYVGPV